MSRRSHLTFQESDGRIRVEILGSSDDFADLVDPEDGSVVHDGPFAMHGGEWKIERVTVTEDLIRVFCKSTAQTHSRQHALSSSIPASRLR
jgi:hypothetical protein